MAEYVVKGEIANPQSISGIKEGYQFFQAEDDVAARAYIRELFTNGRIREYSLFRLVSVP